MSIAFFELTIIFLSIIFTSSFLSKYMYNKKLSNKYEIIFELPPNIFITLIFISIYFLLFYINYKLLLIRYPLRIGLYLCWLFIICFLNGYDKVSEAFVILDGGVAFKTAFLGINKNSFIYFRDVKNWYFSPKNPNILIICYTLDDNYLEKPIYIPYSEIERLKDTLSLFIRSKGFIN